MESSRCVSSRFVFVALLLTCISGLLKVPDVSADDTILNFDCRRRGSGCIDGSCNQTSGVCVCANPGTGGYSYDCHEHYDGDCNQCTSNGRCSHGKMPPCVCNEGYYGSNCQIPRVQVSCKVNSMYVVVNPYGNFNGDIFVFGHSTSECQLKAINGSEPRDSGVLSNYQFNNVTEIGGFGLEINHTSQECGDAEMIQTVDPDTVEVSRQFFISYLKNIADATDQMIKVNCTVPNDTSVVVESYLDVDNKLSSEVTIINIKESASSKINLTIVYSNDSLIDPKVPIPLGTPIVLKFTLNPDAQSVYRSFTVDKCVADNSRTNQSERKSTDILDKSCAVGDVRALFYENFSPPKQEGNTATLALKAFMFLDDSPDVKIGAVQFNCTVLLCELTCPKVSCDKISARRKRATDQEEQVSALIKVMDPVAQVKELKSELSAPDCLKQPDMIAVIATLGGLILILIIICIIIVSRLMKSGKKVQDNNFAMHIPRTYLNSAYKLN